MADQFGGESHRKVANRRRVIQEKDVQVSTQQLLQLEEGESLRAFQDCIPWGGGGAYSEMPVTERGELSDAVARSIYHRVHTAGLRIDQESTDEKEEKKIPLHSGGIVWWSS